MPECHKCKYNGHPNKRCLKCPGPSKRPNRHGQRIVSLDAMPESEIAKLSAHPARISRESKFADFMRLWIRMPSRSRDMFAKAIISQPRANAAIAHKMGISRQAVSKHLLKIAMAHPELRTVLRLRMNRQRHDKQGEIFKKIQINTINTGVK